MTYWMYIYPMLEADQSVLGFDAASSASASTTPNLAQAAATYEPQPHYSSDILTLCVGESSNYLVAASFMRQHSDPCD